MAGIMGASYIAITVYKFERDKIDQQFRHAASIQSANIHNGIKNQLSSLHELANLYNSSSLVDRATFTSFADKILRQNNSIQALEWVPEVLEEERESYETSARQFFPDFKFTDLSKSARLITAPIKKRYFPIYYIAPLIGNESALGLDPSDHPIRNTTLREAIEKKSIRLSPPTPLVQGSHFRLAWLVFIPVYKTPNQKFYGLVEGVYYIDTVFKNILTKEQTKDLIIEITDTSSQDTTQLFTQKIVSETQAHWYTLASNLNYQSTLDIAGRKLSIAINNNNMHYRYNWLIAVSSFIATLVTLLSAYSLFYRLASKVQHFRQLAESSHQELNYREKHDQLTGLLNRKEYLERLIDAANKYKQLHQPASVCYVDLDQFKIINDLCSHAAGDQLLSELAEVIGACIQENDSLSRLGGDEFGILLDNCDLTQTQLTVESILSALSNYRFTWDNRLFSIGASIGIVEFGHNASSAEIALAKADAACHIAKENGRNRYHVYQTGDNDSDVYRQHLDWTTRIHEAMEGKKFRLRKQAITPCTDANEIPFFEILICMLDSNNALILPDKFIPAAERFNLMPNIDKWVVEHSFQALSDLQTTSNQQRWSINLSGQALNFPNFAHFIENQLDLHNIKPDRVCFEITETAVVSNLSEAIKFIKHLRKLGCFFALDDFGSGMSSFTYLKYFPIDYIKIDGSFVRDLTGDDIDFTIVNSIHQIAKVMGIKTIAEFVEDDKTLQKLKSIGIDYAQGYYLDTPHLIHSECQLRQDVLETLG